MASGIAPDVGGLFGGILASIVVGIVIDAMVNEMTKPSAPGRPQDQVPAPVRSEALQRAVEQQRRFVDQREQELLARMTDTAASRLADSSLDMGLLESEAWEAGRVFDRGVPVDDHSAWMRVHDAWFSTDPPVGLEQASVAQPLPTSEQRLVSELDGARSMRCTVGGQLCAFPDMNRPPLRIESVTTRPVPSLPRVTSGGDPVVLDAVATAARVLGSGAPDAPMPTVEQGPRGWETDSCQEPLLFEDEGALVSAARRRVTAISQAGQDPRTYVDILTTAIIKKGQLFTGIRAGLVSQNLQAYSAFMRNLICETFTMLSDSVTNPAAALQRSEAILESVPTWLADAQGGKISRLALSERPEEGVEEVKEKVLEDLRDVVADAVKKRALDRFFGSDPSSALSAGGSTEPSVASQARDLARDAVSETYEAGYRWFIEPELSGSKLSHWLTSLVR